MALPKQRHTRQRRDRARRELALEPVRTQDCTKCGSPVLAHRACPKCGEYRGRQAVRKPEPKLTKKKA